MKTTNPRSRRSAKVLFSMLIIAVLASMVVGALLVLAQQHHYMTARSMTWNSEIPIAEAGIEEAMAHLNSRPKFFTNNGWQLVSGRYSKTRALADGYYFTTFTNITKPTIISVGYGRIPRQTNYTSRTVVALASRTPPNWGFVGKTGVSMNGNPYVDSYNSSDTNYSTGGFYDPAKRNDQAGVATLATNSGAISGSMIYGSAATGPAGSVSGRVGDGDFLSTGGTQQQEGHVYDDFNMAIPNVSGPTNWNPKPYSSIQLNFPVNGVTYNYVLNNGDYEFPGMNLSGSGGIYIKGPVARIWFKGDFKMSSGPTVTLAPGARLEMYMSGSMDLSGHCVINPTGVAANCAIYGLPTCTSMKYTGSSAVYCTIYAPQANITLGGDSDFHGSIVGNSLQFSGNSAIHYDEALGTNSGPAYKIVAWEER